jgi:hypothetical protein
MISIWFLIGISLVLFFRRRLSRKVLNLSYRRLESAQTGKRAPQSKAHTFDELLLGMAP